MRIGRLAALAATVVGAVAVVAVAHGSGTQAAQSAVLGKPTIASQSYTPPDAKDSHRKLVFDANFSGTALNPDIWSTCYYWATANGCTIYGNGEYEWYIPSQVKVSGGLLHLTAQRKPVVGTGENGKPEKFYCRSGMVTTLPGFSFEYGDIQVVARIPYTAGLWSAIWLSATNHQWPPEMDLLEHWDNNLIYFSNFHGQSSTGRSFAYSPNLSVGWHTIGLYWSPTSLVWYIDGKKMLTETTGIPHQMMYLIINVAENINSRDYAGTCNGTLLVKSVKVWQP